MPSSNFRSTLSEGIASMRADPCADVVRTGTCHPCQDRAATPIS
jgi:hypothetical protein